MVELLIRPDVEGSTPNPSGKSIDDLPFEVLISIIEYAYRMGTRLAPLAAISTK